MSDANPNLGPQFSRQQYADAFGQFTQSEQPEAPSVGTFRKAPPRGQRMMHVPEPGIGSGAAAGQNATLAAWGQGGHPGGAQQGTGPGGIPRFESPEDVLDVVRGMETDAAAQRAAQTAATPRYTSDVGSAFGTAASDIAAAMEV
jgi:hypothetical protein